MPMRRIGRPGLIGLAARSAVVAGTAAATAGAVDRHQARTAREQYEAEQYERMQAAQMSAPPPVAPAPAPSPPADGSVETDLVARLEQLSRLHAAGVLSDSEFAAAKGKLLG